MVLLLNGDHRPVPELLSMVLPLIVTQEYTVDPVCEQGSYVNGLW